jgi:hypothetical protein
LRTPARKTEGFPRFPSNRADQRNVLVFPSPGGSAHNLSNFALGFGSPALDKAELPRRRIYDMRHSFATLALAAGVPIEWVARQMGHRDTRVTLRHHARWLPATDDAGCGRWTTSASSRRIRADGVWTHRAMAESLRPTETAPGPGGLETERRDSKPATSGVTGLFQGSDDGLEDVQC